jgi:hypothetical protein
MEVMAVDGRYVVSRSEKGIPLKYLRHGLQFGRTLTMVPGKGHVTVWLENTSSERVTVTVELLA